MECKYSVTCHGKIVGSVCVQKEGLYYRFSCRCSISGDNIYRLLVISGNTRENLGIPVPDGKEFVLDKKIPAKHIPEGKMVFELIPKQELRTASFIPISPAEPFSYISCLKNSFLVIQNERLGITI